MTNKDKIRLLRKALIDIIGGKEKVRTYQFKLVTNSKVENAIEALKLTEERK